MPPTAMIPTAHDLTVEDDGRIRLTFTVETGTAKFDYSFLFEPSRIEELANDIFVTLGN